MRSLGHARLTPVSGPRLAILLLALGLFCGPRLGGAQEPPAIAAADRQLLSESDLWSAAPASFVARLEVAPLGATAKLPIALYRAGSERLLAVLLDPRERGKAFLKRGAELWFLAPGAKRPVRLGPGYRLAAGLSFDELLGLDLAGSFEIERLARQSGVVTFHLRAKATATKSLTYPAARWVVDERRRLPLRCDLLLADGRVARVLEIAAWRDPAKRIPARLVVKDPLRGGAPIAIEIATVEPRELPAALFDPADATARQALLSP